MSQLHQAHCLRQCGRHCRDKGDQQQAADDGHIVHKHVRHDLGKRGAAHLDAHEQGVAHRRGDVAELWDFVDVPVKNYSSGMIARLGFAIATEVKADILVCDEILSVGDFMFQHKCHERMEQMLSGGTTLLFVSHSIEQVKQLCKRAIWIDHGRIRGDGPAAEVCDAYVEAMQRGE